ncbi:MAG: hypothetical protein JNL74_18535 [Fibrobacteres bacterium]|nr:hypothetical protein [Fibrobacterota bacterium]
MSGFWDSFRKEILNGHVKRSAISDSVLATILKEKGVGLFYSADRDFMKFKHLRIVNPIESK